MDYKLCKNNGNMIRCDFDCRKCANLVYDAMTDKNEDLKKENDELRMMNDELRTMNSDLLYRNRLLMETTGPAVFKHAYSYGELSDEIEGLKEDIIRLDKCLSKRQCVQLERIKEERDGE